MATNQYTSTRPVATNHTSCLRNAELFSFSKLVGRQSQILGLLKIFYHNDQGYGKRWSHRRSLFWCLQEDCNMTAIRITYEYVGSFFLEWSPLLDILTFLSMDKDMTLHS